MHMCVLFNCEGWFLCKHRGQRRMADSHSFEAGSLSEPGARLTTRKPQWPCCSYPQQTGLTGTHQAHTPKSIFHSCWDQNSGPHPCAAKPSYSPSHLPCPSPLVSFVSFYLRGLSLAYATDFYFSTVSIFLTPFHTAQPFSYFIFHSLFHFNAFFLLLSFYPCHNPPHIHTRLLPHFSLLFPFYQISLYGVIEVLYPCS